MMEGLGAIKCILFSEFHHTAGPKIIYQVPEDYISKEEFTSVHVYIITKPELQDHIITICCQGRKILGCPIYIDNKQYVRNALIFNLCFVFDINTNTVPYENVVKKVSGYFTTLEVECGFLSNKDSEQLPIILRQIRDELNRKGTCHIHINGSNAIHLKVAPVHSEPPSVKMHDVPIINICHQHKTKSTHWDLATQQILGYIDGFKHVARIAAESDVDFNIVKACIQNLVYHGTVTLISVFQYSNVYMTTPEINKLPDDTQLQRECLSYVARPGRHPEFRHVFMLLCALCAGTTVRDLCARYNPHSLGVDERKLIQYGLMRQVIRRLHKFPVRLQNETTPSRLRDRSIFFDGLQSYDEICCKTGLSYQELDEKVENDAGVVVIWK